jgi:hypothetical protein
MNPQPAAFCAPPAPDARAAPGPAQSQARLAITQLVLQGLQGDTGFPICGEMQVEPALHLGRGAGGMAQRAT